MIEMLENMIPILSSAFYKIFYMSIIGSVLAILTLLITKSFDNKLSAKCKCFILLIPLLFFIFPINRIQINSNRDFAISSAIDKVESTFQYSELESKYIEPEEQKTTNEEIKTQEISASKELHKTDIKNKLFNEIIPVLWLVGCIVGITAFAIGNIALMHKINKMQNIENSNINRILEKCKKRLRINKRIEIKLQNANQSPCICGVIHPKILISEELLQKDNDIVENVFMHELSHYKRKDIITNYILLIMTILHWFNPVIYRFFKKIRQEMEVATDEVALSRMDKEEKKQYGFTLINLLQTYESKKLESKILCIADDNKNMERRIKKIKLSSKLKKYKVSILVFVIIIVICMMMPFVIRFNSTKSSSEEDRLYTKVEQYLINLEETQYSMKAKENSSDFKVFIDMAKLGTRQNGEETYVYIWALIESYYVQDGKQIDDGGSSMGYKFTIKNDEVVDYQIPKDGMEYAESMNELFPEDIRREMEKYAQSFDETKLENEVKQYYSYLDINVEVSKENLVIEEPIKIVGEWKPFKAEYNGEDVPLTTIYGSGISTYGGSLVFNSDKTYTQYIAIYSEEIINDLKGTYEVSNNDIQLIPNSGKYLNTLRYIKGDKESYIREKLDDGTYVYYRKNM